MTCINGRNNSNNNNNNKNPVNTSVSNPYKNNIFPSLRPKTTFTGVNPMAWASPQVLKRAQKIRNERNAATAKVNAKRNKSLNAYKASRKNRRTRRR